MPRYSLVTMIMVFVALSVVGRSIYIMTVQREFWIAQKEKLTRDSLVLQPKRGDILACDGRILATSLSEYVLNIDFMSSEKDSVMRAKDQKRRDTVFYNNIDSIATGMHNLFPDIDVKKYKEHLLKGREKKSRCWAVYPPTVTSLKLGPTERRNHQLTYLELMEIKKLPLYNLRSSLNVTPVKMRKNPYGKIANRTIGTFVDTARYGLEKSFDTLLAGKPGYYHREKVLNSWIKVIDQPAIDGSDLVTTLDIDMQDVVESAIHDGLTDLKAESGSCILMDVATGDVKAIVGMESNGQGGYEELDARAISTFYEPGSVFKPMSFLVAMDDGKVTMNDQVEINGGIWRFGNRTMKDANYRSGGDVGLHNAKFIIQKSSNVGTSRMIDQAYNTDPQKFVDGLYRIGAGENLKIPLEDYVPPHFCSPKDTKRYWSRTDLPWMSIGYVSQMAPINILNFYNGIANNGKLLCPRFVKAIQKDGKIVHEFPVEVLREQMAKPEAVKNIQECLRAVVQMGTGKKAGSKYFPISGKTGTAQIWTAQGNTRKYSISFVGFFPSDNPRYSCIVNIQKGAPAYGWMCGLVFKRVAEQVMAKHNEGNYRSARDTTQCTSPVLLAGNMAPAARVLDSLNISYHSDMTFTGNNMPMWGHIDDENSLSFVKTQLPEKTVPNVIGYGLRDAVYLLENMGLNVRSHGVGSVVGQSLSYGTHFKPGETITLTLDDRSSKKKKTVYHPKPVVQEENEENKEKSKTNENADKKKSASDTKKGLKTVPQGDKSKKHKG